MKKEAPKEVKKMSKKKVLKFIDEQFNIITERFTHGATEDMERQSRKINGIRDKIKSIL